MIFNSRRICKLAIFMSTRSTLVSYDVSLDMLFLLLLFQYIIKNIHNAFPQPYFYLWEVLKTKTLIIEKTDNCMYWPIDNMSLVHNVSRLSLVSWYGDKLYPPTIWEAKNGLCIFSCRKQSKQIPASATNKASISNS